MENENVFSKGLAWFKGLNLWGKVGVVAGLLFVLALVIPTGDEPEVADAAPVAVAEEPVEATAVPAEAEKAAAEEAEKAAAEAKEAEEAAAAEKAAEEAAAKEAEEAAAEREAAEEEYVSDEDIAVTVLHTIWNQTAYEEQEILCLGWVLDRDEMLNSFYEGAAEAGDALPQDTVIEFFDNRCAENGW